MAPFGESVDSNQSRYAPESFVTGMWRVDRDPIQWSEIPEYEVVGLPSIRERAWGRRSIAAIR